LPIAPIPHDRTDQIDETDRIDKIDHKFQCLTPFIPQAKKILKNSKFQKSLDKIFILCLRYKPKSLPRGRKSKNIILSSIVKEFPFFILPLTPALSPVCGGEGKGEGA